MNRCYCTGIVSLTLDALPIHYLQCFAGYLSRCIFSKSHPFVKSERSNFKRINLVSLNFSDTFCAVVINQQVIATYYNIQSMTRAGTPRDNAVIESFFGRFKDVLRSHYHYWNCDDIFKVVDDAVHYFNYVKPVRNLNKKTPVQFRIELAI